ncbi:MAG: adenylate kinase [Candidatus Heimdallarchaeota archaeon]|nr:MAG: adenylate kinase [Candidatus Heimdallarchaeota archaeon]
MKLVLLGPPGSGKGTQAKLIVKDFNIPQISTGDLLRAAIKKSTELGLKAKKFMNTGKLVPDDIVLQLLKERLNQDDCIRGFILDGYPRNLSQAQDLKMITNIDFVINIEVNYGLLIERITGRRTCKQCGAIYHIKYSPSKKEGICDKCSGRLFQREDDVEETVKKRIATYEHETKPLIEFYQQQGILERLTSDGTIDEMYQKFSSLLRMKFQLQE